MPAEFRVAKCSSWIEEYHIGNSYPWNLTIFAPAEMCDWYNEVLTGVCPMGLAGVRRWKNNSDNGDTMGKSNFRRV
jgi:hypothetical protein